MLWLFVCMGRSEFYDSSNKQIIAHKRKWCFFARKWNVKTGGPWVVSKNMHTKYKQNIASSNIFFSISCSNIYKLSFQKNSYYFIIIMPMKKLYVYLYCRNLYTWNIALHNAAIHYLIYLIFSKFSFWCFIDISFYPVL